MKKSIIAYSIVAVFLVSCSDSVSTNETNPLAGIWQQIGMVNLEGGKFKDTVFWETESLARPKVKFVGRGMGSKINSLWFRSARTEDSIPSTSSSDGEFYYSEWYVSSKVRVKKDSFFSRGVYYHDLARTNKRRREYRERAKKDTTLMYRSKIYIDEDQYTQYRIKDDGTGSGELWRRLDYVGETPTKLTGIYERSFRVYYNADGSIRDSVSSGSTDERHSFWMFGDKMMARVLNAKAINDSGIDIQQGQALLVNYNIKNDSLVENLVFGTRRFQDPDNLPASWTGPRRSQTFGIDQKYFTITQNRSDGSKNVQYFKKIE